MQKITPEELADCRAWTPDVESAGPVIDLMIKEIFRNDLPNIHLRHSALSAIHGHLKSYVMCMERNYYGSRSQSEIELTKSLKATLEQVEILMNDYYNQEAAAME